jgi:Rieske Fe-S protein
MIDAVPQNAPSCAGCAGSGVSRRAFVSAATLAVVVAVLDACSSSTAPAVSGSSGSNGTGSSDSSGSSGRALIVKLTDFSALSAVGGIARVDTSGAPTALVRTGTSSFTAFSMVCPHQGTTIGITNGSFTCPNHGARFNASGTWIGGQQTTNLLSYSTTYDAAAGTITIARPS